MIDTEKTATTKLTTLHNLEFIPFDYHNFIRNNLAPLTRALASNKKSANDLYLALSKQGEVNLITYPELGNYYTYCRLDDLVNTDKLLAHKILRKYRNWIAKNYLHERFNLRFNLPDLIDDDYGVSSRYVFTPEAYVNWLLPRLVKNQDNTEFLNTYVDRNYLLRAQEYFANCFVSLPDFTELLQNYQIAIIVAYVLKYGAGTHINNSASKLLMSVANKTLA